MNGVEILSSSQVGTEIGYNFTAMWAAVGIVMGIAIVFGITLAVINREAIAFELSVFAGLVTSVIVVSVIFATSMHVTSYETRYKVTVEDSVSMKEFLDKYEILDQEGKIYTVKEKVTE